MILDAFKLTGKVAIVTGCRTGLGQGMAFGLAEAGADIVGIDLEQGDRDKKGRRGKRPQIPGNRNGFVEHQSHRGYHKTGASRNSVK